MQSCRIPHEFRHTRYAVIGPFTSRQVAYVSIGLAPVMWTLPAEGMNLLLRLGLPAFTFALSLVLVLGKWRKDPFLAWIPRLVYYHLNPKARVWRPERRYATATLYSTNLDKT